MSTSRGSRSPTAGSAFAERPPCLTRRATTRPSSAGVYEGEGPETTLEVLRHVAGPARRAARRPAPSAPARSPLAACSARIWLFRTALSPCSSSRIPCSPRHARPPRRERPEPRRCPAAGSIGSRSYGATGKASRRLSSPPRRTRASSGCFSEHREAWARRWEEADVVIDGDPDLQRAFRFTLFHLMASVADEGEAAVGARGLSGPAYRGHVFWDSDVFVLPFLAATHPDCGSRDARVPGAAPAGRTSRRRAGSADEVPAFRGSRPPRESTSRLPPRATARAGSSGSAPGSSRSTSSPTSPGRPRATWTGRATTRSQRARAVSSSSRRLATGPRASGSTATATGTSTA